MRQRRSLSAAISFLLPGVFAFLLPGTIPAPAQAQDAEFDRLHTSVPAFASADCAPMAVARLTSDPDEENLATLPGNLHPMARSEFDRGMVPDDLPMEHIIMMLQRTPEQENALQARIDQMHNSQSPLYHQWLKTEQVGSCYGVADADIARISNWLQAKGFTVDSVPAGKTLLIFTGTAGLVRDTFHTEIHFLNVKGKQHIANMSEPQIPAAFASVVAGFRSLHDFFPKPTAHVTGLVKRDPKTGKPYFATGKDPSVKNALASKGKPNPDVTYPDTGNGVQQFLGPQDFYTIYNETPLLTGTSCGGAACNGAGQSIGVIEETDVCNGQTGTSPDNCNGADDLKAFRSQFGLPTATVNYMFGISNYCTDPGVQGPAGTGEEGEADLDLQWAGAVAPGAALYYVACNNTTSSSGVDLAASYAVNNMASKLSSFSVSYGLCENVLPDSPWAANSFYNALWEQAAAQGQTVVVSSGDSGDDTCDRGATGATSGWNVNGLASTPFNVATGGTDFSDSYTNHFGALTAGGTYWNTNDTKPYGSALSYIPETTWNSNCGSTLIASYFSVANSTTYTTEDVCNGFSYEFTDVDSSGSGGISSIYSKPTWQNAYGVGLASNYSSSTKRNLPDVSLFASAGLWNHALLYCESDQSSGTGGGTTCDYSNESDGGSMAAGGTSFVAPQVNGLMAIINQAHPSGSPAQPTRQGQADYTLYALAAHEYGTPSAENLSTTKPSVLTCESNYLSIAEYSSVFPSCVFYNINRTPVQAKSTCSGTDSSNCVVDGNDQPCDKGSTDCYTKTSSDSYGILSISTTSFEPAWYQSAGFSDAVGLGSFNIANLVNNWTSTTWLTKFASTTALATSAGSIASSGTATLTATVKATGRGGTVSPAGVVEFFKTSTSGTLLGTGPIVQTCTGTGASATCDGVATYKVSGSALSTGSNSIVAYFEGDGANDAASTSSAVSITVTGGGTTAPTLTYPTPGSTLPGPSETFKWSAVSGSQGYWLFLGTTGVGSKNLYDSNQTAATSVTVMGLLPTDGVTIYARVYSKLNGTLYYNDYTYKAAIKPPVILSPAPGSTLTSTTEKFTWNAAGGQGYWLFVGTTGAGSKNIIDTGEQTATSATVSNLPSNGEKLYVRVYNRVNGTLYYNDYTYKSK